MVALQKLVREFGNGLMGTFQVTFLGKYVSIIEKGKACRKMVRQGTQTLANRGRARNSTQSSLVSFDAFFTSIA
jgi:hypothetical protein